MPVKVLRLVRAICWPCKKMRRRYLSIHMHKSTHMECHTEATGIEWREFALNGDNTRWMGWFGPRLLGPAGAVGAGDVVKDALHEDDADVNAAGDIGQELAEEIVDGVEGIAGEDTGDG
jgi:hypothetical protein